jgi:hypothetical protein
MKIEFVDGFDRDAVISSYTRNYVQPQHTLIMDKRIQQYLEDKVLVKVDKSKVRYSTNH